MNAALNKQPPKLAPLEACLRALEWAADDAFEAAMREAMTHLMKFGQAAYPEWKEQVQQMVSLRLEVCEFSSQTAHQFCPPQSAQA